MQYWSIMLTLIATVCSGCGSDALTSSNKVVHSFSAESYYEANSGVTSSSDGNATITRCVSTLMDHIDNDGTGSASGVCVADGNLVVSQYYNTIINLDAAALAQLRSCIASNDLNGVPSDIDCNLGICGRDAGTLFVDLSINGQLRSFTINLNLNRGMPTPMKNILNCLRGAGMLPTFGDFSN